MQYATSLPQERIILCHTLQAKNQSDQCGFVQPVAEVINGQLVAIERSNFCSTEKVFITSHYEDLENNYPNRKLFQLHIRITDRVSDNINPELACKYVASYSDASAIKPKDYYEVLNHSLPPPSARILFLDQLPGTNYVFVNTGTVAYGPFKWSVVNKDESQTAVEIDFLDAPLPNVTLAQYQTYKIDSKVIDGSRVESLEHSRFYLQGLSVLRGAGYLDYASDDEIFRYCAKIAGDQGLRIIDRNRVDTLVMHVRRNSKLDNEFNRQRLARMVDITEVTQSVRDEVAKAMGVFLNSDNGRPIVENFIEQNERAFIEKLREEKASEISKDLAEQVAEVAKAEQRIVELNERKNSLNDEIQQLNAEKEKGADLSVIYAQSDEALVKKREELNAIENKIKSLKEIHNLVLRIDDLNADIRSLERRHKEANDQAEQAKEATREIINNMNESNAKLQKRMAELKPFVEAINGSFSSREISQEDLNVVTHVLPAGGTAGRQKDVVVAVQASLEAHGRHLEEHEVANLLITLQQSFLTILAGLPGTGKTSLARLITKAQNINMRLREVAVSRGWTSQKDLIGYYNPLTSRFQPANTGMYSFLKAIAAESNSDRAMAYILLDEANLSPIEHYWSAFMGFSDYEGERKIILGEEQISIPDNLRFIATINYDGTTEPLSPRLINRAPVIVLDAQVDLMSAQSAVKDIVNILPVSANQMREFFGLASIPPELDKNERSIYEQIKNALRDTNSEYGMPVVISPRKEIAIQQYCAKARMLMNIDRDMMALDFAVQQHILPLIQGTGPKFAKRLDNLRNILVDQELPESEKMLNRIISYGESDLQTYDFFCW